MEVLGLVAGGLGVASETLKLFYRIIDTGYAYRHARFGFLGLLLYATHAVDTDALERLHIQINTWTDEQALAWKSSQLSTYNAISVASAIFATVGITVWQLTNIMDVHWIVRALTGSSTVLGVLSIATATHQYQKINQLDSALSVRLWLSTGPPRAESSESLRVFKRFMSERSSTTQLQKDNKYKGLFPFYIFPIESSVAALKIVALPGYLLYLAVLFFLVGFVLYPLFMWLDNIDGLGRAHRNVFIFFVVTTSFVMLYWIVLFVEQTFNNDARNREYGLGRLYGRGEHSQKLEALKCQLEECQALMAQLHREPAASSPSRVPSSNDQTPAAS